MNSPGTARRVQLFKIKHRAERRCLRASEGKRREFNSPIPGGKGNGAIGGAEIDPNRVARVLHFLHHPIVPEIAMDDEGHGCIGAPLSLRCIYFKTTIRVTQGTTRCCGFRIRQKRSIRNEESPAWLYSLRNRPAFASNRRRAFLRG